MTTRNIVFQSNEPKEILSTVAEQKRMILTGDGISKAEIKSFDIDSNTITVSCTTTDHDDEFFDNEVLPFIDFAFFKNKSGERFDVSITCNHQ